MLKSEVMVNVGISKPRWRRTWFLLLCVWTDSQCKQYHTVYMLERRAHILMWQLTSREREGGSQHAQACYKTILLNVKAAIQKCLGESRMDCFFFYTVDIKGDVNFSLLSQKSWCTKNPQTCSSLRLWEAKLKVRIPGNDVISGWKHCEFILKKCFLH